MGTGDWNDGMNRVGAAGRGESVWLGWFLHRTLSDFAGLATCRGDSGFVARATDHQLQLQQALERHGWDGNWYRRAFFDDGRPLGSAQNEECRIDAIAQSWAVLSGAAGPVPGGSGHGRGGSASSSHLATTSPASSRRPSSDQTPIPDTSAPTLPASARTAASTRTARRGRSFAYAQLDREDRAGSLFAMLNPVNHTRTQAEVTTYRVEPYVVAADVYSVAPHVGRGGWTWYTGASGWLYRAGLEAVLGLEVEGDRLRVHPCLPPDWTFAEVTLIQPRWRVRVTISAGDCMAAPGRAHRARRCRHDRAERASLLRPTATSITFTS